mgnify:CR=1 FL=1
MKGARLCAYRPALYAAAGVAAGVAAALDRLVSGTDDLRQYPAQDREKQTSPRLFQTERLSLFCQRHGPDDYEPVRLLPRLLSHFRKSSSCRRDPDPGIRIRINGPITGYYVTHNTMK